MNELNSSLSKMKYNFGPDFVNKVMEKTTRQRSMWPRLSYFVGAIAASIVLCVGYIYLQDGGVNIDTLLGVDELNSIDTIDFYTYL